jgi:pyruvate/2-oxoglutarate dehydrogenase complex dihydrolipoamide dehydrogenase (E3) component
VVYAPWLCLGRGPDSEALGLNTVNIETDPMSGKVVVDDMDATTVPHIYCIGDAAYSRPELTPVAIKAGKLLSRRLFGNSAQVMDYDNVLHSKCLDILCYWLLVSCFFELLHSQLS